MRIFDTYVGTLVNFEEKKPVLFRFAMQSMEFPTILFTVEYRML